MNAIYTDESLIVIEKPSGLLSVPDRYLPEIPNALESLKRKYGEVRPVHRLDKETSGLLCFARTQDAQRSLSQQFEQRSVTKTYLAIIEGTPAIEIGEIDYALAPHPGKPGRMIVSNKGKDATSKYRIKEMLGNGYTLAEVKILTGRTHQIRVHMAAMGNPLVVDAFYGRRERLLLSEIKGRRYRPNRSGEERPLLSRVPLHAHTLAFEHPDSGEEMSFTSDMPKDMRAAVAQLRKWG
ncbi:MAG: RluA family pseudouridine synthase [Bacteroidota bacterium]